MPEAISTPRSGSQRALLVGFFQTIGDLECLYAVEAQLQRDGVLYDVAPYREHIREAIDGAIDLRSVRASDYSHVYVICGPCTPAFFEKFGIDRLLNQGLRFVGVNLTMIHPLAEWNPFDVLIERDSERGVCPDLTFSVDTHRVPVVSTCFIEGQGEYGERQRHGDVISTVDAFLASRDIARIVVDTRWPRHKNAAGLASPGEIVSAIARTDVLITNRLHGLVFGLKAGVPVLAIDAIAGGGKVSQQAERLGWPLCVPADQLNDVRLAQALSWCQSEQARAAVASAFETGREFDHGLATSFGTAYQMGPKPIDPSAFEHKTRRRRDVIWNGLRRLRGSVSRP